jgi:hypothetical protein
VPLLSLTSGSSRFYRMLWANGLAPDLRVLDKGVQHDRPDLPEDSLAVGVRVAGGFFGNMQCRLGNRYTKDVWSYLQTGSYVDHLKVL